MALPTDPIDDPLTEWDREQIEEARFWEGRCHFDGRCTEPAVTYDPWGAGFCAEHGRDDDNEPQENDT